ncbi:hypothetical protein MASR1M59_22740 [Melaminivora sp.]
MTTPLHLSHLAFDRGIERITHAQPQDLPTLPEREQSLPPDAGAQPQLDNLLALPNLDDHLTAALRPQLTQRDLLMPSRFDQALHSALGQLSTEAEQLQDMAPEDARVLNRAVRLLKEESSLRELAQMYRNALYQG